MEKDRKNIEQREKHLFIIDEVRKLNPIISMLEQLINNITGQEYTPDDKVEHSMPVYLKDTLDDLSYIIQEKRVTMENLIRYISDILFIKDK